MYYAADETIKFRNSDKHTNISNNNICEEIVKYENVYVTSNLVEKKMVISSCFHPGLKGKLF
jgi:hypothetical protein